MSLRSSRAVAVALVTFATFTYIVAYSIAIPVLPALSRQLGASPTMIGLLFGSFGVTLLTVSVPMGAVSDRIGRKNNMILFTALGAIAAAPLLFALGSVSSPYLAFILVLLALAIASFYTSISGVVKAELFPAEVRALGVGLTYAVANAGFGGTAEYVALWLKSSGHEPWFAWYVAGMLTIGLAASLIMPDTRKYGYLEGTGQIER